MTFLQVLPTLWPPIVAAVLWLVVLSLITRRKDFSVTQKTVELPSKLYSLAFNGRAAPTRINIGISEDGLTRIYFPGATEGCVVRKGHPISIDVSGNGPGPDVVVLVEAFVQW